MRGLEDAPAVVEVACQKVFGDNLLFMGRMPGIFYRHTFFAASAEKFCSESRSEMDAVWLCGYPAASKGARRTGNQQS